MPCVGGRCIGESEFVVILALFCTSLHNSTALITMLPAAVGCINCITSHSTPFLGIYFYVTRVRGCRDERGRVQVKDQIDRRGESETWTFSSHETNRAPGKPGCVALYLRSLSMFVHD